MSLLNLLPFRYRVAAQNHLHERVCRPILETPPIRAQDDGLIIFSMMGTKVLLPYLVAIKSLWVQMRSGRIVILDDGTLTDDDKAVLNHHCDNPVILSIHDVDIDGFVRGGTWERFLSILDLRHSNYVIQLDSDTVTIGPVPELIAAIDRNQSYTLGGDPESAARGVVTVTDYTNDYLRVHQPPASGDEHVQMIMERGMEQLEDSDRLNYIRGCSGFAGFAKDLDARSTARTFTDQYREIIGSEKLSIWGSEQFMSNLVIANEPKKPLVLSGDRYVNFWGDPWSADTSFIHFLGTHRYTGTAYADATHEALKIINDKAEANT